MRSKIIFIVTAFALALTLLSSLAAGSLVYGNQNDEIASLQGALKELGYYMSECDGFFLEETKTALFNFQLANGMEATGLADPQTLEKLKDENAVTKKQYLEKYMSSVTIDWMLKPDDMNNSVKTMQRRLKELGYYNDELTDVYGSATTRAVCFFQLWNHLPVTGIADSATLERMVSANAISVENSGRSLVIQIGDKGKDVKQLQMKLYELGYFEGVCTAVFGSKTREAVLLFQKYNGLEENGACDVDMRIKLEKDRCVSRFEGDAEDAVKPLRSGERSKAVALVQTQLKDLGFYSGEVTGEYDQKLSVAVYDFQVANEIPATGEANKTTRLLLNSGEALSKAEYENAISIMEVALGSEGSHVARLQKRLSELGYYSGAFTGKCDEATQQAIRLFQLKNGVPVTGTADPDTRALMNSEGAVVNSGGKEIKETTISLEDRQERIEELCVLALGQVFKAYEAGKVGPDAFSNAGLVKYVFSEYCSDFSPTVSLQYKKAVTLESWTGDIGRMEKGQQVFWKENGEMYTGIYVGDDIIVYASSALNQVVMAENLMENENYEFVGAVSHF